MQVVLPVQFAQSEMQAKQDPLLGKKPLLQVVQFVVLAQTAQFPGQLLQVLAVESQMVPVVQLQDVAAAAEQLMHWLEFVEFATYP